MLPRDTWAVVVGVEEYPHLPGWTLPGPAMDAVRFVNWLLLRGVPPDHIRLCLSATDAEELQQMLTTPVDTRGATQADVMGLLKDVATWTGDLLYFFWAGHGSVGSIDPDEPRGLFFSDASKESPDRLSVPGVLAMLNHQRRGFIPRQAFFIDACGNFQARARFTMERDPIKPAVGVEQALDVGQFRFYASRRGEAAVNLDAERAGAFSKQLMIALEGAAPADWPPDLVGVATRVQAFFNDADLSGGADQRPFFEAADWDGNTITARSPKIDRRRRLANLRTLVENLGLSTPAYLSLFRAAFPSSPKLDGVQSLGEIFEFLDRAAPVKGRTEDWSPEAEFAERILRYCLNYNLQAGKPLDTEPLATWLRASSDRELTDLRERLDAQDLDARYFLLVELAEGPTRDRPHVEQAWLYRDGDVSFCQCWPAHELVAVEDVDRIRQIVRDAAASGAVNIVVEFITAKKHLGCSPYLWMLDVQDGLDEEIGNAYPVVVRWRDRLADQRGIRGGRWIATARQAVANLKARGIERLHALPLNVSDHQQLWLDMEAGRAGDFLIAGHVPVDFGDRHPLILALLGGAAAICWWADPVDEKLALKILEPLMLRKQPDAFVPALHEGRKANNPETRAICSKTVLFWDHLDRNPYQPISAPTREADL